MYLIFATLDPCRSGGEKKNRAQSYGSRLYHQTGIPSQVLMDLTFVNRDCCSVLLHLRYPHTRAVLASVSEGWYKIRRLSSYLTLYQSCEILAMRVSVGREVIPTN